MSSRRLLFTRECAAEKGRGPKKLEETIGNVRAQEPLRLAGTGEIGPALRVSGKMLEDARLLTPIEEVGGRDGIAIAPLLGASLPNHMTSSFGSSNESGSRNFRFPLRRSRQPRENSRAAIDRAPTTGDERLLAAKDGDGAPRPRRRGVEKLTRQKRMVGGR